MAALDAAVAAKPEGYIYENPEVATPRYVHYANTERAEPGCLVGWALHYLGMPIEELSELGPFESAYTVVSKFGGSGDIAQLFNIAQYHQDGDPRRSRKTWKYSVHLAKKGRKY